MQVIFSHGQESGPWGTKIKQLAATAEALGCTVTSVDYQDLREPTARSERLTTLLAACTEPVALVGSSMGGYVSLTAQASQPLAGMFLLAPAIYLPGYDAARLQQPPAATTIVHGWEDDVVPVDHSIRFAQSHGCTLHLVPDGHRLTGSLPQFTPWFRQWLQQLIHPQQSGG